MVILPTLETTSQKRRRVGKGRGPETVTSIKSEDFDTNSTSSCSEIGFAQVRSHEGENGRAIFREKGYIVENVAATKLIDVNGTRMRFSSHMRGGTGGRVWVSMHLIRAFSSARRGRGITIKKKRRFAPYA